jgi:hypothetical protein
MEVENQIKRTILRSFAPCKTDALIRRGFEEVLETLADEAMLQLFFWDMRFLRFARKGIIGLRQNFVNAGLQKR